MLLPPDRLHNFVRSFYTWDTNSLGSANPRILADKFPFNGFLAFSEIIGLSIENADMIYFYLMFTSAGLSMYFLTTTAVGKEHRHLAGVISALFYMFNPYFAIHLIPQLWVYIIFLPLVLGLYIKGLNEKRGLKYIFFMSLVWVLTSASDYVNPKFAIFSWAPLFLYLVFHIIVNWNKSEISRSFIFTGKLMVVWTALNSYWLLPTILTFKEVLSATSLAYTTIGASRLSDFIVGSCSFVGAVRLLGYCGFLSGFKGFPYFYWAPTYGTALFIAIGFLIPILAFACFLHKPRDKHVLFFCLVTIGGLLAMTGAKAPFGELNMYLVTHIPLLVDVVSAPYQVGGMYVVLGYAFLLGLALSSFYKSNWKRKLISSIRKERVIKGTVIGLILFLVVGIYAYPLWTGDVIYQGNEILGSSRFNIPTYYYDARAWLSTQQEDFNIFQMPYSILGYAAYTWKPNGFSGPDPTEGILNKPVVSSLSGGGIGAQVARYFASNFTDYVAKLLALMNVKYVLFHRDANWKFLEGNSWYISIAPEDFQSIMKSQKGFHLEASFGELDFYRNDYWKPMYIIAASHNILIDSGLSGLMQTTKRGDFNPGESVLLLSDQLNAQQLSSLPIDLILIQNQTFDSYSMLTDTMHYERIVYVLSPQPLITARYYSEWKGVISTSGQGDPYMLVFQSSTDCPYISSFPMNFTNWNSYNSTLIYITTASSPVLINSISANGKQIGADAWWETGTSWVTGWPIMIPPNQLAIIQVNQQTSNITLQTDSGTITLPVKDGWTNPPPIGASSETSTMIFTPTLGNYLLAVKVATGYGYGNLSTKIDDQTFSIDTHSQEQGPVFIYKYIGPITLTAGYHTISTSGQNTSIPVYDGLTNPINWTSTFTNQNYAARYYPEWKAVVRTDGSEPWDTLSFPAIDQSPYTFPPQSATGWNAYNSTLVYLTADDTPLRIDEILTDGNTTSDIIGVWWETGWMGMATKPVTFPIIIPPNQKAIIQINHKADTVTLKTNPPPIENMLFYSLKNGETFADANNLLSPNQTGNTSITYEKINPTKYTVHVNASSPFYLVFSESYHNDWVAYIDGQPIPDEYHFTANGFANGWYINKTGTFTITLEFWPQKLFYAGSAISVTTLILCTLYVSKDKIKTIYRKYIKHKQVSKVD